MEYVSAADQPVLSARYRTAVVLALAFASSIIVFLIVAQAIDVEAKVHQDADWRRILYAGAVVAGLLAVALRRVLLARPMMASAARQGVPAVLQRLGLVSILGGAMGEMVGILGLLGYMITGDFNYSWRLGVIGLLLVAYSFPRRSEWAQNVALVEKSSSEVKLINEPRV